MEITIIIIVALIFLLYKYVYKFYSRVKLYPRGPMPLPIIGNCLSIRTVINMLRNSLDQHFCYFFEKLHNNYGDSYTFWFASKPVIFLNGIALVKEVLSKNECSDRCAPSLGSRLNELFFGVHHSLVLMNFGKEYKLLRSLSLQSLRKFLSTDKISKITHEIIKDTVDILKQREIDNNAFEMCKYIDSVFIRLSIESIFGKKISFDNHFIEQITTYSECLQMDVLRLLACEYIPLYKYVANWTSSKKIIDRIIGSFECWFKNDIKQNLSADDCGTVGEALISFANAAQNKNRNDNEVNEYLNDSNMISTLVSLFIGASHTSHDTFKWIFVLMCYYPEMQQKMRNEINTKIGNNKIVDLSDKEKCVYVNAFICETLRYRNVTPYAFTHITSSETIIGDISIPKGTTIVSNQFSILNDSRYWNDPDIFNPERFINSEQNLVASKLSAFIPFGTGKRMCVGDKFGMNVLFLVLASLLQATNGKKFVLSDKHSVDLKPMKFGFFLEPKIFKVCLENE